MIRIKNNNKLSFSLDWLQESDIMKQSKSILIQIAMPDGSVKEFIWRE